MPQFENVERSYGAFTPAGFEAFTVVSKNLRGRGDVVVYTPEALRGEAAARAVNVPVVILLHGAFGSSWVWAFKGGVHQTLERMVSSGELPPMILVMPSDGLRGGSMVKDDGTLAVSSSTGYLSTQQWNAEGWIMDDVIPLMRQELELFTESSPLFLAGFSMGGFGTLRLGAKYCNQFKGVSAHSSVCELERALRFSVFHESELEGPREQSTPLYWLQANRAQLPPVRFDCGADDHLFPENERLHTQLKDAGIPHTFEINPGAHTWKYWGAHVADSLRFFAAQLAP